MRANHSRRLRRSSCEDDAGGRPWNPAAPVSSQRPIYQIVSSHIISLDPLERPNTGNYQHARNPAANGKATKREAHIAMAPNTPQTATITCAESIAILDLLHSVPEQPSSNPVIDHRSRQTDHTLPFDIERSLASTLAFLARTTDNPNYIPAVCIEEDPEPAARLNVLLAVNKARPENAKQVLADLEKGFGRIFALLARTDDDNSRAIEAEAFKAVVSMCYKRPRDNLINTLGKVSRYRETATFLYRIARRFALVRKMQIVIAELPEKAFDRVPTDQYTPSFEQTIAANHARAQLGQICCLLSISEQQAQKLFAQQSRKTLEEAKIHAEVQLIYYCELHSSSMALWPRVIRSSKDACWLCNAFILTHGKMYTSKCHGKLYPGWRLPLLFGPSLRSITDDFNCWLRNRVSDSIQQLLKRKKKTIHPDHNESTLSILLWGESASAVATEEPTPTSSSKNVAAPEHIGTDESDATGNAVTTGGENTPIVVYNEPAVRDIAIIDETKDEVDMNLATFLRVSRSSCGSEDSPELIPGTVVSKSIAVCEASQLYAAGRLDIQVEYAPGLETQAANDCHRRLIYEVEWLTREEAVSLEESEAASVWDAESLEGEVSCCTGGSSDMYISARGALLRVRLTRSHVPASDTQDIVAYALLDAASWIIETSHWQFLLLPALATAVQAKHAAEDGSTWDTGTL
ncbi:hypothetical protein DL769_011090 [Monosporascus sp. CRB-8-3]|nr:hypothetical protein DL769_011090 [Monosporascus sp. CRB-8-3]